jgi:hypothetical protein
MKNATIDLKLFDEGRDQHGIHSDLCGILIEIHDGENDSKLDPDRTVGSG